MEFAIEEYSVRTGFNIVSIKYKGQVQMWPTAGYKNASAPDRENIFTDLNKLLTRLAPEKIDRLWNIYLESRETLDTVRDPMVLHSDMAKHVKEIYDIIDYETVRQYVYVWGDMTFPSSLKNTYEESGLRGPIYVDRTYLKDDYIDLVILALGLRPMIPIWGDYIAKISSAWTASKFKEKTAYELINNSAITKWPGLSRLQAYVEASVDGGKAGIGTLLGGLSSTEIPYYLMALSILRKLAIGPLYPRSDDDNLIRLIFNFLDGTFKRLDSRFSPNNIRKKELIKESAEDDNSSVWDMYKMNQGIPDGDKILIEKYTERPHVLIKRIDPNYDPVKLDQCLASVQGFAEVAVEEHHVALVKWIMGPVLPPKSIHSLPKKALMRIIAVSQAVLWHWGYKELALLVAAERVVVDADGMFSQREGLGKIPKQAMEKLHEIYPYYRRTSRKHDPAKPNNLAANAINQVCSTIINDEWRVHAPEELIREIDNLHVTRVFSTSPDIRSQMADLIIRLNAQ